MRKITFILSLIILAVGVYFAKQNGWFQSPTAFAVGDLTVNWGVAEGNPIFVISNATPGQTETRTVQISNGASSVRPLGIKAASGSATPTNFPTVLKVKITEGVATLYEKALSQFFADSATPNGVALGNINSGATRTINIAVTFDINAGNEFQNANAIFDLQIGLVSVIPEACQSMRFNGPTIYGTEGNNDVNGTSRSEIIVIFEGNDTVNAGSGNDCIIGLTGNKKVNAGSGNDVIVVTSGNDILDSGSGNDVIEAGEGNNNISAGAGDDKVDGGNGTNNVVLGAGNDILDLGNGNNTINADSGNDKVIVGSGVNNVKLGAGNDIFIGAAGNNTIKGESGNDDINNGSASTGNVNGATGIDKCVGLVKVQCEL